MATEIFYMPGSNNTTSSIIYLSKEVVAQNTSLGYPYLMYGMLLDGRLFSNRVLKDSFGSKHIYCI